MKLLSSKFVLHANFYEKRKSFPLINISFSYLIVPIIQEAFSHRVKAFYDDSLLLTFQSKDIYRKGLFPLWLRCALRAVVNDSERATLCSAISLSIVHYRSLKLTIARNAQRSRSGNTL